MCERVRDVWEDTRCERVRDVWEDMRYLWYDGDCYLQFPIHGQLASHEWSCQPSGTRMPAQWYTNWLWIAALSKSEVLLTSWSPDQFHRYTHVYRHLRFHLDKKSTVRAQTPCAGRESWIQPQWQSKDRQAQAPDKHCHLSEQTLVRLLIGK